MKSFIFLATPNNVVVVLDGHFPHATFSLNLTDALPFVIWAHDTSSEITKTVASGGKSMFPEKYEVSKNNLTVLNVAPEDAGVFYCISRVKGGWYKRLVLYLIVLGEKYFKSFEHVKCTCVYLFMGFCFQMTCQNVNHQLKVSSKKKK